MKDINWNDYSLETQAIRAGHKRTHEDEHSMPIFATSSYVFKSAEEAALRFTGQKPGNIYSRFTNPTVNAFQERLALMEKGERCLAFASGMAAIMAVGMGLLKSGDHVVCSRGVFGNTVLMFQNYFGKFGVTTDFVDLIDAAAWESAIKPNTRFLFLETPSNPLIEIADIELLANLAHKHNRLLIVDNCFCTPVLQKPFESGADIVIHSATKYIDGQGFKSRQKYPRIKRAHRCTPGTQIRINIFFYYFVTGNYGTANTASLSIDILGCRMDNNIGA